MPNLRSHGPGRSRQVFKTAYRPPLGLSLSPYWQAWSGMSVSHPVRRAGTRCCVLSTMNRRTCRPRLISRRSAGLISSEPRRMGARKTISTGGRAQLSAPGTVEGRLPPLGQITARLATAAQGGRVRRLQKGQRQARGAGRAQRSFSPAVNASRNKPRNSGDSTRSRGQPNRERFDGFSGWSM